MNTNADPKREPCTALGRCCAARMLIAPRIALAAFLLASLDLPGFAQLPTSFQNLDFESAQVTPTSPAEVPFEIAFPGWTGYWGAEVVSIALINGSALSSVCISLYDSDDQAPVGGGVKQGQFYAVLQSGHRTVSTFAPAAIAQSGIIPSDAYSLLLNASSEVLEVSFNGTPIPMRTLTCSGGYSLLGGDVSAHAGQFGELRLTVPLMYDGPLGPHFPARAWAELDDIRFSTSPPVVWPAILSQPSSQTAEIGAQVRLAARVTGDLPLAFRWIVNQTNILSNATNSFLDYANIEVSRAGAYTVVVTNAGGAVTSAPAMLSVIAPVERRLVPGVTLVGEVGSYLALDAATNLGTGFSWLPMDSVSLASTSQLYFDLTAPLPPQRFYRAWQTGSPSVIPTLDLHMIPAITLTGNPGNKVRVDGINQFGPTDAWFTLDTVTLTNTSQLYFDVTAPGQPQRLYRLVPVP